MGGFEAINNSVLERLETFDNRLSLLDTSRQGAPAKAGVCPPPAEVEQSVSTDPPSTARSPRALVRRLKRRAEEDSCDTPIKYRTVLSRQTPAAEHRDSDEEFRDRFFSSGASRPGEFSGFSGIQEGSGEANARPRPAGTPLVLSARRRAERGASLAPYASESESLLGESHMHLTPRKDSSFARRSSPSREGKSARTPARRLSPVQSDARTFRRLTPSSSPSSVDSFARLQSSAPSREAGVRNARLSSSPLGRDSSARIARPRTPSRLESGVRTARRQTPSRLESDVRTFKRLSSPSFGKSGASIARRQTPPVRTESSARIASLPSPCHKDPGVRTRRPSPPPVPLVPSKDILDRED